MTQPACHSSSLPSLICSCSPIFNIIPARPSLNDETIIRRVGWLTSRCGMRTWTRTRTWMDMTTWWRIWCMISCILDMVFVSFLTYMHRGCFFFLLIVFLFGSFALYYLSSGKWWKDGREVGQWRGHPLYTSYHHHCLFLVMFPELSVVYFYFYLFDLLLFLFVSLGVLSCFSC